MHKIPTRATTLLMPILTVAAAGTAIYKHRWDPPIAIASSALVRHALAPANNDPRRHFLFFFRPGDCYQRLIQADTLDSATLNPRVRVLALMAADPARTPDWRGLAREAGVTFDVRLMAPEAVAFLLRQIATRSPSVVEITPDGRLQPVSASSLLHVPAT